MFSEGDKTNREQPCYSFQDILCKIRFKISQSTKLYKHICQDKLRLELEHITLSIVNSLALLEDEIKLINKKCSIMEVRSAQAEQTSRLLEEKCNSNIKEIQRELHAANQKNAKLLKHNEYLSFANRGIRTELEECKKYISEYKKIKCQEAKLLMKRVESEARASTEKVCKEIVNAIKAFQEQFQVDMDEGNEKLSKENSQKILKDNDLKSLGNTLSTLKKRSQSASLASSTGKKNMESRLAKIVFEQARIANSQKGQRYLDTYDV